MVVNCAQLMDKYVGESAKNIEKVFDEAKAQEAVLVFDECEGLFAERSSEGGSTARHDSMNIGVLLHHMETFSGVVVAITNRFQQIDSAFHRRFKFILEFPTPNAAARGRLWRLLVPKEAPLHADVDFARWRRAPQSGGGEGGGLGVTPGTTAAGWASRTSCRAARSSRPSSAQRSRRR